MGLEVNPGSKVEGHQTAGIDRPRNLTGVFFNNHFEAPIDVTRVVIAGISIMTNKLQSSLGEQTA
jgi:hypothetical protein